MRVDAGGDDLRVELRAVFEPHADGPAAIGEDVPHRRLAANLDAQIAARRGERRGQSAHAALHVAPHAARPARFAHHVVQQHVRAAGRADREERADDRVGGERGLQHVAFEPAIENRPGRRRSAARPPAASRRPSSPSARYRPHSFLPSRSRLARARCCRHSSGSGSGSGAAWLSTGSSTCGHALEERVVARVGRRHRRC